MLYNQNNLNVAKMASKSVIKPEIASVFFTKDKTVATDSWRLLEVTVPKHGAYPEDFSADAMRGVKPFMVDARRMLAIKIPPSKMSERKVLALKHVAEHSVSFLNNDGDTLAAPRISGEYPDYERIIPNGRPIIEMKLNGKFLAELLVLLAKIGKADAVTLKFYGEGKPLVIEASNDEQSGRGFLMGMH